MLIIPLVAGEDPGDFVGDVPDEDEGFPLNLRWIFHPGHQFFVHGILLMNTRKKPGVNSDHGQQNTRQDEAGD